MNLKKIYLKFIFITDILSYLILCYAMLTEWYNRGMSSMPWLLLGLLFFITAVRKILKKPPILMPLFKQLRTMLFNFIASLHMLGQWSYGASVGVLNVGLLFFIIGVTIGIRKILKKPSLGELFREFMNQRKRKS